MASYLSGSNVQEDRVQTLHLMNPGYSGYADASNAGNLVLVNPSAGAGQDNSVDYSSQQQQHYIGFALPPAITQSSLPQQSTLTTMYNSSVGQQNPSSNLYTNRVGSNSYNWPAVNELPFIPSNDVTQITQSLTARLTSMNSGQQSNSDISEFNRRHSLHDEQASMLHNCVSLGLNMDSSQASDGTNRGLSLSLSSQQQSVQMQYYNMQPDESGMNSCPGLGHVIVEDGTNRGERIPNKWIGNLSHFRASSRDGLVGSGLHNSLNDVSSRQMHIESNVSTVVGSGGLLTGSKYLKAAQQLLDEVVSVARAVKRSSSKHLKLQAWMAPSSFMDNGSFARDGSLPEAVTTAKEGTGGTASIPSVASGPEQNSSTVIELTREERQELQTKKAKLMAMLDEVDRRYKQYYSQMEIVVTSFESAAGLGAAKTYTALALQTISRHFRCLRDAISGQIRLASRALGEEDLSSPGLGRGETSRLRYLDHQLRQQRALQQLGMMQQHAWRPQRGLPERSVSILRAWLFEHFLHPYPKDADKVLLARQTGLTRSQVSNWFINARVRLWKPMVEEMYVEETKESDRDRSPSADQRSTGDKFRSGTGDEGGIGNPEKSNQGFKQVRAVAGGSDGGAAAETQMISDRQHSASDVLQQASARNEAGLKMAADSPAVDAHLFQEKQGVKKARNSSLQRDSLAAATMLAGVDVQFKSDSNRSEESFEHESKNSLTMRRIHHALEDYHMGGGAERYAQEEFAAPRYASAGGGSNSVSLTLGLQHCDDLSLAGTHHQQHFYHHQEGHDDAAVAAAAAAQDYYSMNNSSNFEALAQLQSRKRFAQLLHHDFVA